MAAGAMTIGSGAGGAGVKVAGVGSTLPVKSTARTANAPSGACVQGVNAPPATEHS